jgi:hypothetical protein
MPPVGRPRQNKGPCAICGLQDNKEIFRRLKDWSLEKANKHSHATKLKIGDELCKKHYNELVVYDRHKIKSGNKRNKLRNKDFSYNDRGDRVTS